MAGFKNKLELHLLGNIYAVYRTYLIGIMPGQHQLIFHDLVPDKKLADKITCFDIGLALELNTPASRDYTITNKFFQYIQSGLPVIANKTQGQNEAFEKFRPGFLLSQNPDSQEIQRLEEWLNNPVELTAACDRVTEAAGFYNWEKESGKLTACIQNLLSTDEKYN
jgi:glycosyltransferase involved in cell wall biosynthesis